MNKRPCPICKVDNYSARTDDWTCWHCGAMIPKCPFEKNGYCYLNECLSKQDCAAKVDGKPRYSRDKE